MIASSCGGRAPARIDKFEDRSWIRSDAVIFGASDTLGVFRVRLGSNRLEPIGRHDGAFIANFELSDDRTKLIYALGDARGRNATHWHYDIRSGQETKLEALTKVIRPWDDVAYSPDGSQVAFSPRPGDGERVSVLDLRTRRVRTYELPGPKNPTDALLFDLAWSRSGAEVQVGRRRSSGEDFWSIDTRTGVMRMVEGRRTDTSFSRRDASVLPLVDGGRAMLTSAGNVVVETSGSRAIVIAESIAARPFRLPSGEEAISACDGVGVGLVGAIDGRYVVYVRNGEYWVYGVVENRHAKLPGTYLVGDGLT